MSRTVMFAGPESGPFEKVAEFQNSWGSAAFIWSRLAKKWMGAESAWMISSEEFWKLARDERLSELEREVLASTYDHCLVKREDFRRLAGAYKAFVLAFPPGDKTCSLLEQAEVLNRLAGDDHGLDFVPAVIGWQQTTVSENLWSVRESEDDYRPYDLSLDTEHWFLYETAEVNAADA